MHVLSGVTACFEGGEWNVNIKNISATMPLFDTYPTYFFLIELLNNQTAIDEKSTNSNLRKINFNLD